MSSEGRTSTTSRAELRRAILDFIVHARVMTGDTPELPDIDDDDNLFDRGVVGSLMLAELLVEIERMTGVELDLLAVDPETFFTLRGLLDHVAHERERVAGGPP